MMIPYRPEPQEEYDIRLVAEKTNLEGNGLNLGLVMGGRQGHLAMGGGGKKAAWCVEMIDGKSMHNGNITCVDGLPWPLNQKVSVLMQVRQDGVRVLRNGKEIINWKGGPEQLSLWDRIVLPDRQSLFFFSEAEFAIHELTLIPPGKAASKNVGQLPQSVWPHEQTLPESALPKQVISSSGNSAGEDALQHRQVIPAVGGPDE